MTEPGTPGLLLARLGVTVVAAVSALAAIIEILLTPLYLGSVLFPITVLLAIVTNVVLPRLAREILDSPLAGAAPVIVWFIVVVVLGFFPAHGSVLLPGGGAGQTFSSLGTVFLGLIAGVVTLARWPGPWGASDRAAGRI